MMIRLRDKHPVWFAVLWILVYIVTVNIGDALAEAVGIPNIVTAPLVIALAIGPLLYVKSNGWFSEYGITLPTRQDLKTVWYYAPLALLILVLTLLGTSSALGLTGSALIVLLMIAVGFLEELIFRGFLYKAILKNGGVRRAIIISGVTFGIGHMVNLLRGYTGSEQLLQILAGVALGIVLVLLFVLSGSILPGVLFHTIWNSVARLTQRGLTVDVTAVLVMLVVCAVYGTHRWLTMHRRGRPGFITTKLARPTAG